MSVLTPFLHRFAKPAIVAWLGSACMALAQPILTVERNGAAMTPDETVQAGTIVTTMNWIYEFKLTNTGNQTLTPISLTNRTGCSTNVSPPSSLAPGQSATMSMRINTTEVGPFDASFIISSNSASQPAYKINFAGTSTTVAAPVFSSPSDVPYPGGGILGRDHTFGPVTLLFAPQPGTVLTAVQNVGFDRRFQNLPDGSIVTADFGGETYRFLAGYRGGTTAALTLTLLGDGVLARTYPVSTTPRSLAMEGDGSFRHGLARYDEAGELDPAYQGPPNLGAPVFLTLLNGDIYHASTFSETPQLVRLRIDGSRDLSFNAPINGYVGTMASLPDGRIVIGGTFNTVSGQTRNGIARLHPDGSVDTSFAPQVNLKAAQVKALAVQADGRIIVATNYSFNPSTYVARFLPDGAVDTTFTLTNLLVDRLLIQPDGKIVILYNSTKSIRRLHSDGTVDNEFTAAVEGTVADIALQADGKFLICGDLTKVGNHPCSGVARLHPDGSPDPTFAGRTENGANQILINGKNKIFVAGNIWSVNGVGVQRDNAVAELTNSTASSEVQQTNANTIRWMRQGGAAELHWVKADLLPEGGAPVSLGMAQRIAGGWEITSPTPISNATVRLYGPSIHASGMAVMVKEDLEVGTVSPNVEITRDGQVLSTTVANHLGAYPAGTERSFTLKIRNNGAGALTEPVVSIAGAHATDFSIMQSSPTPLAAGEERAFILKLNLLGSGLRTAQLTIRSSDPEVPAHVIPLSIETQDTLNPVFNSATDVGLTSLTFNPALANLGTITLGFAPAPGTVLKLVETSGPTITGRFMDRTKRPYVSAVYNGVTYWFAVEYIGSSINLRVLRVGDPVPDFFVSADSGASYAVSGLGIALQPDGKALVSGGFQTVGGKAHPRIVRLHPDGTVDESFNADVNAASECILVLDDGRIVLDGYYYDPEGDQHDTIICLNSDGSLVESFKPDLYTGENQYAMASRLLQLKSGKILIGGRFHFVDGVPRTHVALLNLDGSLDESFNANLAGQAPNLGHIYSLAEQADGKILVGGSFGSVGGATRYCLARLNADGTLDTAFNPILGPNTTNTNGDPFGTRVSAIAQLPNGKILIGGEFSTVNTRGRTRVALLNEDGTLDETFLISSVSQPVTSFAVQEDGTILMAGPFGFRRILPTGQTATGYSTNFTSSGGIHGLALDHEGNLWMTGTLTIPGGWPAQPVLKLQYLPGSMDFRIENGNTAFWEVSGTAPALRDVKFEVSTDGGAAWTSLGAGTKVTGGWSLANLTLPPNGFIRAKGDAIITNRGGAQLEETLLFGRQPTAIEEWRMEQFGSFTNQRGGADLNDADKDGVANLMEYAFNLDPHDIHSAQVPAWTNDSSQFEINFTPPANVEGVRYGVEWSSSMNPSDWQDVSNHGTGGGHRYVVPKDAPLKFMRLKVTNTGSLPPP